MSRAFSSRRRAIGLPAALGVAALLLAGCDDLPEEPSGDHEDAATVERPPLDEPTDEPVPQQPGAEDAEADQPETFDGEQQGESGDPGSEAEAGDAAPDEQSAEDEAAASQSSNDVLDVTEFSAEPQRSRGFPELLTSVPEDSNLLLGEVRVGIHEGYHRIVFDHVGEGAPGWTAEYVAEAVEPGSGFPVEMDAEVILYVGVEGLVPGNAGEEEGQLELREWSDPQGTVFTDVATTLAHHGSANYYIGLDAEREYRVSVWEHPNGPRLIIDVLV
ncbi:AMIN-like domain-containing (lipo)protein [Nesterenkonia ebinurensis]|uniref:AMIN-like domain-containing (lipo)protein n=1 Tax=Nesterenkonia ebinurensis TaxID=2608252 RepID=UPI00123D98BE|nr:hypothetical protein [Nesterenkonia ebinurensis]